MVLLVGGVVRWKTALRDARLEVFASRLSDKLKFG